MVVHGRGTRTAGSAAAVVGGVTLNQQSSGLRTFDINKEGVSQYGMFADWFREVRIAADEISPGLGDDITRDMLNGSETFLGIWERAVYGGGPCVKDGSTLQVNDLHAALGLNLEGFLKAIGQPADRAGSAYTYCAQAEDGSTDVLDVVFDDAGTAVAVRPSTSGLQPLPARVDAPEHDHAAHLHAPLGVPADADLALGAMLVLGLTGVGAGSLTGRTRREG